MTIYPHARGASSAVAILTILMAGPSVAASANDSEVEEIVVTTQKREQSLTDVPVSVSAYSGTFLETLGVDEFDEISELIPGLIIQEQSPNNPGFVIRGITSDSGSAQIAPRVSIYLNGVDVSRSRGSHFEMFDIERIEVAKGPQATLFGNAASIGAVSVITARPQEAFESEFTLGYGNFDTVLARGYVTGGTQTVQGRLAVSYRRRDGFIENIAEGQDDLGGIERLAIRPSLRLTPNEDLTIDLVLNYEKNDDTGTSFKSGVFIPSGGAADPFSFAELGGSPFSEAALGDAALGLDREVYDANLTIEYQINDSLSLTSVSGYREFDSLEVFDADGFGAFFLEFAEDATGDQFSQELRLNYESDRVSAFVGGSFFHEDGEQRVPFSTEEGVYLQCAAGLVPGLPCQNADGSVNSLSPIVAGVPAIPYASVFGNTGNFDTYSVFADVTWRATDRLELTAGLRFAYDDRVSGFFADQPNSVITGGPLLPVVDTGGALLQADDDFSFFLPRFNALYRLSDTVNIYASVGKGRRSNVIDVTSELDADGNVIAAVTDIPAEIIWNYEGGIKGSMLDGRVSFGLNAFYQEYENFQVTIQEEDGSFLPTTAGDASNFGVEAEFQASLTDSLSLFGNLAYIDAEIDDEPENGIFAGNRFRLQPEWSSAAGFFYERPISEGLKILMNGSWTFRSSVFFEPENQPIAGLEIGEGSINQINLRLGIGDVDDRWTITGFATNLADEEFIIDAGNTGGAFGTPTFVAGPPRFYGIELTGRF